jgi:hypothetical protein
MTITCYLLALLSGELFMTVAAVVKPEGQARHAARPGRRDR